MIDAQHVVEQIGKGDPSAEDQFARFFYPRVIEFGHFRTGDRDLANDLAQDVLIAGLGALRQGQIREPQKLVGFIYGIAHNLLHSGFRKRSREKTEPLEDHTFSYNENYEEQERQRRVLAAMEGLDPIDRAILSLTLVDGYKPGEIARQLKLSGEVVRQRKTRVMRRLADQLRPSQKSSAKPHKDKAE